MQIQKKKNKQYTISRTPQQILLAMIMFTCTV